MITFPRTTVELFAGIGGFRVAANRHGLTTIWANDNCPSACAVYRSNFGDAELHEGDIALVREGVPEHVLLTAGFPCQPFSSAGKKRGIRDPRGTLFQEIARIIARTRPRYFILENVKRLLSMERGSHFATILDTLTGLDYDIEWRLVNAVHLGLPQNRQRVFMVGTRNEDEAVVRLASLDDLGDLCPQTRRRLADPERWTPLTDHDKRFPTWGYASRGRFIGQSLTCFSEAKEPPRLRDVLQEEVDISFDFTAATTARLEANTTVDSFVQGVQILSNQKGGARMGYTIFGIDGVAPTLTSTTSRHYERYKIGDRYRRLTNIEYARIQGFDDHHCRVERQYFQYALYGNAVPPPMAEWALRRLFIDRGTRMDEITEASPGQQLDLAV